MSDTSTGVPQYRWLIVITVMLVAILEVLDTTIVTVSLPAMMGELGANSEQITWIVTTYIVASAMVIPLTGFLVNLLGRRKLLFINIIGFMLSSVFCGVSTSIYTIVFFRIMQGLFGGSLIPVSQACMTDTFSPEERSKAMAIWGMGIMAAPVLGPSLGGIITEYINWRWIFFINIPVCLLSFMMGLRVIPDTPKRPKPIDWLGLFLLSVGLGSLQMFLDIGNTEGWFESRLVVILAIVSFACISLFFIRSTYVKHNIIKLDLFKNRLFLYSTILLSIFCAAIFSVIMIQPIWMQNLMGYPVITTGMIAAPRGIAAFFGMGIVVPLMKKYGTKPLLIISALLCSTSTYYMTHYNLNVTIFELIWPTILQGIGMAFFFVPLSSAALRNIPREFSDEAAGLFGYGRMLGTSIGVSLISTYISRQTQNHTQHLSENINAYNTHFQHWLTQGAVSSHQQLAFSSFEIGRQASMMAFLNSFLIVAIAFMCMIPFVLKLKEAH